MPCSTITITPDESEIVVEDFRLSEESDTEALVEATIRNNVVSGDGQTLDYSIPLTVDGSEVDRIEGTLSPGGTAPVVRTVSGLSASEHKICLD